MEFFLQRDDDKSESVEPAPFPDFTAVLGNRSEVENSSEMQQCHKSSQTNEGHYGPFPESAAEHLPPGQTVRRDGSCFDSGHDRACQQDDSELQDLVHQVVDGRV